MSANVRLYGDAELIRRLNQLEPSMRKRVLRPAVTAAARPIRQSAKGKVPVRFGALKKSIDIKTKSYRSTAVAIIGPRSDQTYQFTDFFGRATKVKPSKYAHLVEDGFRAHAIPIGKGRQVIWQHPGYSGVRFMASALQEQGAAAMAALNRKIAEGIEKYA